MQPSLLPNWASNFCLEHSHQNGHLTLVKMLIAKAADVNAQNKGGQTAMHMAME
jgi:ankyrin repeat protein